MPSNCTAVSERSTAIKGRFVCKRSRHPGPVSPAALNLSTVSRFDTIEPNVGRMSLEVRKRFMSHRTLPSAPRVGVPRWQFLSGARRLREICGWTSTNGATHSSSTGTPLRLRSSANSETLPSVPAVGHSVSASSSRGRNAFRGRTTAVHLQASKAEIDNRGHVAFGALGTALGLARGAVVRAVAVVGVPAGRDAEGCGELRHRARVGELRNTPRTVRTLSPAGSRLSTPAPVSDTDLPSAACRAQLRSARTFAGSMFG